MDTKSMQEITPDQKVRSNELEAYLRQTMADQGGECTWEEWLAAVSGDEEEFAHEEAVEFVGILAKAAGAA